ncbi:MAG: hydroxymethylbilane synthase [Hyphomicrobium sp.]
MQAGEPVKIRIGTRGSPLALAQAHQVAARLTAAHALAPDQCEIVIIKTTGDRITDRPLIEAGGKGLFTKELEEALYAGSIDLAVHSMKDMPALLPPGLAIAAILEREDPRDAFVSLKYASLADMPAGAIVGTSSPRRRAQVLRARPDLAVVEFRGNVETRLRKLEEGVADATFLACAGLNRLGLSRHITEVMDTAVMLPAVAQGAIGIEIRAIDETIAGLLGPLDDARTALCVAAERAYLSQLEGSCRTPIAGFASWRAAASTCAERSFRPMGRNAVAAEIISEADAASAPSVGERLAQGYTCGCRAKFLRDTLMHLLITRPQTEAAAFRAELEALGHKVTVEPLLRIEFLPILAEALSDTAGLIATSRNGLRALAASPGRRRSKGAAALRRRGPAPRKLARDMGFTEVTTGPGTGAGLVPLIVERAETLSRTQNTPLAHVRGEDVAFDLKTALAGTA